MSEIATPRLMAAAKEFNIGSHTLIDFLVSKGFPSDDLKPTSKISEDMYRVLQVEFQLIQAYGWLCRKLRENTIGGFLFHRFNIVQTMQV